MCYLKEYADLSARKKRAIPAQSGNGQSKLTEHTERRSVPNTKQTGPEGPPTQPAEKHRMKRLDLSDISGLLPSGGVSCDSLPPGVPLPPGLECPNVNPEDSTGEDATLQSSTNITGTLFNLTGLNYDDHFQAKEAVYSLYSQISREERIAAGHKLETMLLSCTFRGETCTAE